jgi:hypothetical protein
LASTILSSHIHTEAAGSCGLSPSLRAGRTITVMVDSATQLEPIADAAGRGRGDAGCDRPRHVCDFSGFASRLSIAD